jgi:hypothetical protein
MMAGHSAQSLQLTGDLTIATADGTREVLLAAIADGAPIEVDCSDTGHIDLSFVQLMIAARKLVPITIKNPVPDKLTDVLRRGGFLNEAGVAGTEITFLSEGE